MKRLLVWGTLALMTFSIFSCCTLFVADSVSAVNFAGNISDNESDWYDISVTSTFTAVDIQVDWVSSSYDLDIYLYDPSGTIVSSDAGYGTNYRDIYYSPSETGTFHLEIYANIAPTYPGNISYNGYCNYAVLSGSALEDSITVTYPDGGEALQRSNSYYIEWETSGRAVSYVNISLYMYSALYSTITSATTNDGSYLWYVSTSYTVSDYYRIRITNYYNTSMYDESDAYFSIESNADSYEPDNYYYSAKTIYSGSSQTHSIHEGGTDIDWVTFTLASASDVVIETWGPAYGDLRMWLYDSAGVPTTYIAYNDDWYSGYPRIAEYGLSPGTYYVKIDEFYNDDEIAVYYLNLTTSIASTITVSSPNGGEEWQVGTSYHIYWNSTGDVGSYVKIELIRYGSYLESTVAYSTLDDGEFYWAVPLTIIVSSSYKIRITSTYNTDIYDDSDNYFSIDDEPLGTITVTYPNGGESWDAGSTYTIRWNWTGNPGSLVGIELYESGVYDRMITSGTTNDGEYSWTVPTYITDGYTYKIKITSTSQSTITDYSNTYFSITSTPVTVTVLTPDGGESWDTGTSHAIMWTSTGSVGNVKIELYVSNVYDSLIASSTSNDGSFQWYISTAETASTYYKIKITSITDLSVFDFSDSYFTLTTPGPTHITVTSPAGGERWVRDTSHSITWYSYGGADGDVKIELYRSGLFTTTITTGTPDDGSYLWTIPLTLESSSSYEIRVTSTANPSVYAESDYFYISEASSSIWSNAANILPISAVASVSLIMLIAGALSMRRPRLPVRHYTPEQPPPPPPEPPMAP